MIKSKNTVCHLFALTFFIGSKFAYSLANNNMISFLTKPTNAIISFITNNASSYSPKTGFYYSNLNIVIDKSCSGFNFWMLLFLLLFFSTLKFIKTYKNKLLLFLATLLISYLLTLFTNTSRILVSLFITQNTSLHYSWLHQAEGVFIYLSFLIVFYLSLNYLQNKFTNKHEKLA
ncbi:exosortase K [Postechiella marina]|uniref:exosortase K n=1 Tax=Postechiella marina TaxID=943941 RepID=UPI003CD0AD6C